jgi:uncharacterized UBP type Zn finger protein
MNIMLSVHLFFLFLRDASGQISQYEAVSVIEYQGSVRGTGESQGHYICDVKDKSSQMWFRTNDNNVPIPISLEDVSKCAYVILYRKTSD